VLKLTLLTESIELHTPYGNLLILTRDTWRKDFGPRVSADPIEDVPILDLTCYGAAAQGRTGRRWQHASRPIGLVMNKPCYGLDANPATLALSSCCRRWPSP
jgi:hypothetical protein